MYKILFEEGDRHDATIYYVDIIKEALSLDREGCVVVNSIKDINSSDIVVVVNSKALVRVLLRNYKQKVICWYQGIMPEEINVFYRGFTKLFRIIIWTLFEMIALKVNVFSIFVSERMKIHYENKYRIDLDRYYVMPCFNQTIQKENFYIPEKYNNPTFVYAGTLSEWQCINEMLSVYKDFENVNSKSKLMIYTKEMEQANLLLKKYRIKNGSVDYVPFNELNNSLKGFKYGFIIRKDIEMNKVSTPTKMNSYMANGIIPIYTDCIDSFKKSFSSLKYQIRLDYDNLKSDEIISFDRKYIDPDNVYFEYNKIFSDYYSREYHIHQLRSSLIKYRLL